jgi:hypothetical protein
MSCFFPPQIKRRTLLRSCGVRHLNSCNVRFLAARASPSPYKEPVVESSRVGHLKRLSIRSGPAQVSSHTPAAARRTEVTRTQPGMGGGGGGGGENSTFPDRAGTVGAPCAVLADDSLETFRLVRAVLAAPAMSEPGHRYV